MERVNRRYGSTIVIVTHNDAIRHMAHHTLRMRDGRVLQDVHNEDVWDAARLEW
jgi:putative ABC transport system ATP-binding protein